jgi:hypothetical protein
MHVPVYFHQRGSALPELREDDVRYVVADNGTFLERRTAISTTSTRVDRYDLRLGNHEPYCRLHCGKIPRVLHRAMLGFFKHAHELHGGEVALVLLYHPELRRFRWHCPEQTVEMARVGDRWYADDEITFQNPLDLPDGYLHAGDAHLHPGSPTPSLMDEKDDLDGLHIIVGNILTSPRYHITFVIDGLRYRVPPELIFDDPDCARLNRVPDAWLRQIRIKRRDRWGGDGRTVPLLAPEPAGGDGEASSVGRIGNPSSSSVGRIGNPSYEEKRPSPFTHEGDTQA